MESRKKIYIKRGNYVSSPKLLEEYSQNKYISQNRNLEEKESNLLRKRDNKLELCMSNLKYICRNCETKEKKARVKKRRQEGKGFQRTTREEEHEENTPWPRGHGLK